MKALTIVLVFGALTALAGCNKSDEPKATANTTTSANAAPTGIPACRMDVFDTQHHECQKK
ncbi:MAG: hypothetical protein EPN70_18865 [Paraburkholderia sp.]|jgi:hypothetical protein|uniref:hypothetical protein n=1 Tax=Paraburkholderia sp. TaxID=1926495 RepID=UPI0011FD5E89|nr:hypothetical protein [Paraburkholderia sp.]TAM01718.1 MAG: hypothetical protein EPN70_18865 [Paraburkholderia sp.]